MVEPRFRRMKKRKRRSIKGKPIVIYKRKKPGKQFCALCGKLLQAIPRCPSSQKRRMAKTKKRPERVFGGVLCGNCTQQLLKERTRLRSGSLKRGDVALTHLKFIDALKKR